MLKDADTEALLVEGIRSYPEALTAIRYFCQDVIGQCRKAMSENIEDLKRALGVAFAPKDILPRRRPDRLDGPEVGDGPVDLGTWVKNDRWRFYQNVSWEKQSADDEKFRSALWISIKISPVQAQLAFAKLKTASPADPYRFTIENENEICLGLDLDPAGTIDLPGRLRAINHEWIRIWSQIGGLSQFLDLSSVE